MKTCACHAVAERIRLAREMRGWSQAQLAAMVNHKRVGVTMIEGARQCLRIHDVVAFAKALGVTIRWLVGVSPRRRPARKGASR